LQGETALHWAAQNNKEALVKLLIKSNADLNAKDDQV
jgi:ankyrin repeat protein